NFAEDAAGLHLVLHYNSDLFRRDTIESLAACWPVLVEGVVRDPETAVGRLPLLSAASRAALLAVRPSPPELAPVLARLVQGFEARVAERADVVAVTDGDRDVTYGELNARANRLARALRESLDAAGLGFGVNIGLCVSRSAELVVGMLAILKAGAA